MNPQAGAFGFVIWPRWRNWAAIGGLSVLFAAGAWAAVAAVRGSPEALALVVVAWGLVATFSRWSANSARCDGTALEVPELFTIAEVPLTEITALRAGRWRSPVVVVESSARRHVRMLCTTGCGQFATRLRSLVPPEVDALPEQDEWMATRRRVWFVAVVVVVLGELVRSRVF